MKRSKQKNAHTGHARLVQVNDAGRRIGERHPAAVLSDAEVEQLLADREAGLSLAALARKWRISKSGAKDLVDGRRRGQVGPRVVRPDVSRKVVRAEVRLTLAQRARLARLGGSKWLRRVLDGEVHAYPVAEGKLR